LFKREGGEISRHASRVGAWRDGRKWGRK
jgi:hypothetical protein